MIFSFPIVTQFFFAGGGHSVLLNSTPPIWLLICFLCPKLCALSKCVTGHAKILKAYSQISYRKHSQKCQNVIFFPHPFVAVVQEAHSPKELSRYYFSLKQGRHHRGATAPLKVSEKEKKLKYGVFSCIKISFSVIFIRKYML